MNDPLFEAMSRIGYIVSATCLSFFIVYVIAKNIKR